MPKSFNQESSLLIFLHIVKAAGTTLRWVMESQFPWRTVLRCYAAQGCTLDDVASMPEARRRQIRFFATHYGFGTHSLFPQASTYVTMFRHPTRRLISQYFDFVHTDEEFRKRHGVDSFADYVGRLPTFKQDNVQVRFVAGAREVEGVSREHLDLAKRNLREHFSAVGLTERFDESLTLFGKAYGWRKLVYVRRNVTKFKPVDLQETLQQAEKFREFNSLDFELYEFAKEMFEAQLQHYRVTEADVERMLQITPLTKARLYLSRAVRKVGGRL